MAKKRVGRKVANVTCPLCNSVYLITGDELIRMESDDNDTRAYFYCDECERNVIVDTDNDYLFKIESLYGRDEKWFWSNK